MADGPVTNAPIAHQEQRLVALTQRAYDATSDRYASRWNAVDPMVDTKHRFLAAAGSPAVADLGCGTGRDLAWFADRGLETLGVDRSQAMLSVAATTAPSARLVRADVRALPFAAGAIDAWWACASLLHLSPRGLADALTEIHRVTRRAGVGVVAVRDGDGAGFEQVGDTGYQRYFCYWAPNELDELLGRAGWRIIEGWLSDDSRGRGPWITRMVRRGSR